MKKIFFYNADTIAKINNRNIIKGLLFNVFEAENFILQKIKYIFCTDDYLLKINQQYLNQNTLTDVITFSFSKPGEPVNGEIYISIDRIKENAKTYNVQYQNELLRVMIHGALHLCGYKDKKQFEKLKMRSKEDFYLNQLNVSREASN